MCFFIWFHIVLAVVEVHLYDALLQCTGHVFIAKHDWHAWFEGSVQEVTVSVFGPVWLEAARSTLL